MQNNQPQLPLLLPFNGTNALGFCSAQLAFGPRVPNSQAHTACRDWLLQSLQDHCENVQQQSFAYQAHSVTWQLTNILAQTQAHKRRRLLLCTHYDCRPWSDSSPHFADYHRAVPGANDGASGVAFILELLRVLPIAALPFGLDIAFFDGEDLGTPAQPQHYCAGSRYFCKHYTAPKPELALHFDMVGDHNATFPLIANAYHSAEASHRLLWTFAPPERPHLFSTHIVPAVLDDHCPLIDAGIPTLSVIDVGLIGGQSTNPQRRYWHTQNDTITNLSALTFEALSHAVWQLLRSMA